jgi:hypothetical protein
MKTVTINPRPFWNAQVRTDWFKDPVAVKDWDDTFSLIKKLGYTQVRYKINLRSIFDTYVGITMPFIFMDSPDLWFRTLEPLMKYCTVYNMKLLLVIDDIPKCVESWGVDGTAQLLQKVIDRVGNRAKYTFDELNPNSEWKELLNTYNELMPRLNFRGNEIQAPPVLIMPFTPWQIVLAQVTTSDFNQKLFSNSINVYVDRRYSPSHVAAFSTMLTQAKVILTAAKKPYSIHEMGLSPDYAQADDIVRGEMILQLERAVYKVGGFRDYGIYCTHDNENTLPNSQFSILNPNVVLGYLKGSGYSPSIVISTKASL